MNYINSEATLYFNEINFLFTIIYINKYKIKTSFILVSLGLFTNKFSFLNPCDQPSVLVFAFLLE
jgi:hypothetical protein